MLRYNRDKRTLKKKKKLKNRTLADALKNVRRYYYVCRDVNTVMKKKKTNKHYKLQRVVVNIIHRFLLFKCTYLSTK